jgi:hypothetical protein
MVFPVIFMVLPLQLIIYHWSSLYNAWSFPLILAVFPIQHIIYLWSSLWSLWSSLFNLLSISGLSYSMHDPLHWSLQSSISNTLFTYGLPYDPCGPPCSIYCLSVVFPIAWCMVLPTDPCGLPYPINHLFMVFPVTLAVLPVQLLLISGPSYSMHGPPHWSLWSSLSNLHIVLISMT